MLDYGKIKGIYKEKLAELAKYQSVSDVLNGHRIYVYQNKMHEYFIGTITSEPGRASSLGDYELSVVDSKMNDIGYVKFCEEKDSTAYIASLRVREDIINRGIGRLMMTQTMEFITDTLGYGVKDRGISIVASGFAAMDIKQKVTRQDILSHRDRLVKFYSSLGFERCSDDEAVDVTMKYNPVKGFDSLRNKKKGDVLIKTF